MRRAFILKILGRASSAVLACVALASCASLPRERFAACRGDIRPPAVTISDWRASTTLDVLTYNIEGLGWPARSGRGPALRRIAAILADLRQKGRGPDIVLFQEVFSGAAVKSVARSGYPDLVTGPGRTQRGPKAADVTLPGRSRPRKGELGIRLATSGLVIASRFPVIATASEPFSRASCAGFDCLANKGIVLARLAIPGVPDPIDILNTHMNSQGASGVAPPRYLASHHAQVHELSRFMERNSILGHPIILGGDFNMRRSPSRFAVFRAAQPLDLVHQYCLDPANGCDVRMSWDGDEPWMDTQDLQLFASGSRVAVAPIRVAAMFDGNDGIPVLSDHDGFRVTYRLSWDRTVAGQGVCDRLPRPD
ncbi:endonuclease/exonuclease/phosphatase family protein [Sphingomonas sp.]|uniref:endonuclease/exonuclease/phosphatase family protein n=1 Tax=Sphingomonas sp. TaxID=28214 RepID=UPI003B3A8425